MFLSKSKFVIFCMCIYYIYGIYTHYIYVYIYIYRETTFIQWRQNYPLKLSCVFKRNKFLPFKNYIFIYVSVSVYVNVWMCVFYAHVEVRGQFPVCIGFLFPPSDSQVLNTFVRLQQVSAFTCWIHFCV